MENNENFVEQTENVEVTTEQMPKTYTEEEFEAALNARVNERLDEVMPKKIARREAKIRKEYERKYGNLEEVLKAGTGKESVEELTQSFTEFYEKNGIKIRKEPKYSDREEEELARAEAKEIIDAGYEEVVEEVDRLNRIGLDKMSHRDKALFKTLAEHRLNVERAKELGSLGVTKDVYDSTEFKEFASKFNSNTSYKDIYDIYSKMKPKKEYQTMGSMKQVQSTGVKDYYTPEEIERLSEEDLDDPEVWDAVRRSMTGG